MPRSGSRRRNSPQQERRRRSRFARRRHPPTTTQEIEMNLSLPNTTAPEGSMVPSSEAALVTEDGMKTLQLLTPDIDEAPPLVIFLLAIFTRAHVDDDFVQDQLDWFD